MGFLDRLLGRDGGDRQRPGGAASAYPTGPGGDRGYGTAPGVPRTDDEVAVERYRYLLRTAPPEAIEQAHAEAFARLTPEQRRQVLDEVSAQVPAAERATSDDPQALARMATRAELRQPGTLENAFGPRGAGGAGGFGGAGVGLGGVIAGSLLASVAGAFIGTAIAGSLLDGADPAADAGADPGSDGGGDTGGDPGADAGGEGSWGDGGGWGGDVSADGGGWGGFGGGDFGGGDFGGGDF